ncbi:MAG TPA: thioredoxin [bacterium]
MSVVQVTDDTFDAEVINSSMPVLVDFWAQWCGPCRIVSPLMDEIAQEYEGKARIAKLDVDTNPKIALEYKVMSIPCMKFIKNGKVVDEVIGAVPKQEITKRLDKLL